MDRILVQPSEIPTDTMFLATNKNTMIALGYLAQAVLGSSTAVDGFVCTPTTPASLSVLLSTGSIMSFQNVDSTAYGTISADTADQIVKQGILLGNTTLSCPAPSTGGQSINYLIQAAFSETDTNAQNIEFYNSADPSVPLTNNINTLRQATVILSAKAGAAATTGTQATPSPDAGYVGLYVVTVANGQTTITSGSISQLSTAPFINPKLTAVAAYLQSGAPIYAADTSGAANTITISLSPAVGLLTTGQPIFVKVANANTGAMVINTNGLGNVAVKTQDGNDPPAGAIKANGLYGFIYDGSHWQIQMPQGGDIALGQCYFQFTSATLVTLSPSNGRNVTFPNGTIQSIGGGVTAANTGIHIDGVGSSNLGASTQYYAYLVAGATPFIDFSTTGGAIDSGSGIMIKNGDATRVLVGRVVTNGSSQFEDQDGYRGVYSWFHRQPKRSRTNFSTGRSTASSSFVEINSEIRNFTAPWSGDLVEYFVTGGVSNSGTGTNVTGVGFDGTTPEAETSSVGVGTTANGPVAIAGNKSGLTEAMHYATLLGMANAGTSTWQPSTSSSASEIILNLVVLG